LSNNSEFGQNSFLYGLNAPYIEELYELYQKQPNKVPKQWQEYFAKYPLEKTCMAIAAPKNAYNHPHIIANEQEAAREQEQKTANKSGEAESGANSSEIDYLRAKFMIHAYRERGHFLADLDPLGLESPLSKDELGLNYTDFGFTEDDLDKQINVYKEFAGIDQCSLRQLINWLDRSYAGHFGAETTHIEDSNQKTWLYESIERHTLNPFSDNNFRQQIARDLIQIETFEQFLHSKFPGAKRFSIEGGDSTVAALEYAIDIASNRSVEQIVLGMAHRGRLSILTKVLGKPYSAVIAEFGGSPSLPDKPNISGDVKYHLGFSEDRTTSSGNRVHLSLTPNPSHLEAVNPVVTGKVRAKQDCMEDSGRQKAMGVLIHGDAAFCGQGVVAENLSMSGIDAYYTGGTLHLVINNQLGFTAERQDTRSTRYATELAKAVGAPIFHVNGDDIEAVLQTTEIASEFRHKFGVDVVIDIVCYRKYGHNEGDEPMFTQPVMYNIIKQKKTVAGIYADKLAEENLVSEDFYKSVKKEFKSYFEEEYNNTREFEPEEEWLQNEWSGYSCPEDSRSHKVATGVDYDQLQDIGLKLSYIPEDIEVNKKLKKQLDHRRQNIEQGGQLDWATGEALAFGALLKQGWPIRLTGQDSARGTFSHRHSIIYDQNSSKKFVPLNQLSDEQASFEVADSNLSEFGSLGFEFGYSLVTPKYLVLWEAQFGDFCNGAQVVFDQFISSSEAKWMRMSGLVVLLPHGFEGQGPEHSSARLERFLGLCARDNMQVAVPSTPASYFHLLRRQMLRDFRKPLIVMTPKSLLRHKLATSPLEELSGDCSFQPVLKDPNISSGKKVKKVIFCSGKLYYELLEAKSRLDKPDETALVRLEELYPYPDEDIKSVLRQYPSAANFIWAQEEPKNMGAWSYIEPKLTETIKSIGYKSSYIRYVGRSESPSPATGYASVHNKEQEELIKQALEIGD
jgi:2-oxoglutarate dehydrogenase E1 component